MAKIVEDIMSQEMNRKEFLVRVGASALTLVGISGIIKTMTGRNDAHSGYGSGAYGGSSAVNSKTQR